MNGSANLMIASVQKMQSENGQLDKLRQELRECNEKMQSIENERLQMRKSSKNQQIESEELSKKSKIMQQQNENLRSQLEQIKSDLIECEAENNGLRENERRRSMEGNTSNSEHLSEKIALQRQLRTLREERDEAEKRCRQSESEAKQLSLQFHKISLQFESAQQRVAHLDVENEKLQKERDEKVEKLSALEAEKFALSKKNNLIYDGNVDLEQQNKKNQQALGKMQGKNDRLRQQRDYAKSKYKELKAKFNALELQFSNLQSRFATTQSQQQKMTSTTLPF